jgi:diaminopimelate decarboxylase
MKIYISGLYSGTNPQPGVGIARSLRAAFPHAVLVGVEYSNRCSGIHWPDFDEIWLQRPWEEINLKVHAREIESVLDAGAYWISSIDLEIMWLAKCFPNGHPNLLTPEFEALRNVAKPAIPAHEGFPVSIAPFVSTELSDWELHAFCRQHDWKVWLKGPYYEAMRVLSWADLEEKRHILSTAWHTDRLFLQAHVAGYEESICLSAYKGELLDCVWMRKKDLTEIGKTWSGDVDDVDDEYLEPLRKIIRKTKWTGGAELEMVRDTADGLWLIEWNPRYPAWIHGSTITGRNLPATLVSEASGVEPARAAQVASEFTRVVVEIPVRPQFPLSPLPEPLAGRLGHSMKHPSGLLQFADRLHSDNTVLDSAEIKAMPVALPETFGHDLDKHDLSDLQTPASIFLESTATAGFVTAAVRAREAETRDISVVNAYSIKTDPDDRLVRLAFEHGFFAEAISIPEVKKALDIGFAADQIILNGPAKWWRAIELEDHTFKCVFCDSLDEFALVVKRIENGELKTETLGIRLRTPGTISRFGVPVDTPKALESIITAVKKIPAGIKTGIHFHMASSNIGVGSWWQLFRSMLGWARTIESLSGRVIETLDIGGGWFPEDIDMSKENNLRTGIPLIAEALPNVGQVICEPGKALAQPSMALATRILEVRELDGHRDVVVDSSIAELPMHFFYPHRILSQVNGSGPWTALGRGKARLLGRLCMEHDIVAANIDLPKSARAGDLLVICDAGAYDRSMSYVFGRG